MNEKDPSARTLYDPIYDAVTFKRKFYTKPDAAVENFPKIIRTFEFRRLSFIRQEGLAWLVFPTTSYTRHSAALGSWYLADYAAENVIVKQGEQKLLLRERLQQMELLDEFRFAALLHDLGHFPFTFTIETNERLQEKYRQQPETKGIELRHERIGISLVKGSDHRRNPEPDHQAPTVFELFKEFNEEKIARCFPAPEAEASDGQIDAQEREEASRNNYTSEFLDGISAVDREVIKYLLDPREAEPEVIQCDKGGEKAVSKRLKPEDRTFLRLVRHLISGAINVGVLDRYNRASRFVSGRAGLLPVRALLHNLTLAVDDGAPDGQLRLSPDGAIELFQTLYPVKTKLIPDVYQDEDLLAYEAMLNRAINIHWDETLKREEEMQLHIQDLREQPGETEGTSEDPGRLERREKALRHYEAEVESCRRFRKFLPFLDDDELMSELLNSSSSAVRGLIRRISLRMPYAKYGPFKIDFDKLDERLEIEAKMKAGELSLDQLQSVRRNGLRMQFEQRSEWNDKIRKRCIVRLTGDFGKPNADDVRKYGEYQQKDWQRPPDWLDLTELYVDEENGDCINVKDFRPELYGGTVQALHQHDEIQRWRFWIFLRDRDDLSARTGAGAESVPFIHDVINPLLRAD